MFDHDHDDGDRKHTPPIRVVLSLDQRFDDILSSFHADFNATYTAHTLALRAKAISAHLTTVVASLNQLTKPTTKEK